VRKKKGHNSPPAKSADHSKGTYLIVRNFMRLQNPKGLASVLKKPGKEKEYRNLLNPRRRVVNLNAETWPQKKRYKSARLGSREGDFQLGVLDESGKKIQEEEKD